MRGREGKEKNQIKTARSREGRAGLPGPKARLELERFLR